MKRVFLISRYPLFSDGLESLLCGEPGLAIVGREADLEEALRCIRTLRPDVVILDDGDRECDSAPAVMRILQCWMGARVIGLNLLDNVICIYQGEQRTVAGVTDLVEAIRGSGAGAEHPGQTSAHPRPRASAGSEAT